MDNSLGTGFVAVFAVSGSVVLLALQVHKRLLSDFMKKMEFEIGRSCKKKNEAPKKKVVRFAEDVVVKRPVSENVNAATKNLARPAGPNRAVEEKLEALPLNWQALYKGIISQRHSVLM
ncbi:OLC1v1034003C1 [Oldenlandia corymbosa var. corymbosa]|uniref:OLC1v1034003C1 n=1 Tax=Oldenlandia corymbosa var. corymbosa TaxID=529605 RepID=A0AAV1CQ82_OLDCO|nr:OLC1v1034003C1 [Oldenlandia corymbosa var. corymbosa]